MKKNQFFSKNGRRNDAMLIKEGHLGRQYKVSLKVLEIKDSLMTYLDLDTKSQNEVAKLFRSLLPSFVVHHE